VFQYTVLNARSNFDDSSCVGRISAAKEDCLGEVSTTRTLQERESFMAIVNALAGIMVSDLTTAETWYEQLLSRPADARPMEGLAEWKLADGGWIQVFQDKDRAGSSSVTFLVSGLDDQLAELKAKGISIERTTTSDYVKTATVTDPAGNRVVFAELTGQH
jgi:predicted enzyme related to lactoylglutathione lyase